MPALKELVEQRMVLVSKINRTSLKMQSVLQVPPELTEMMTITRFRESNIYFSGCYAFISEELLQQLTEKYNRDYTELDLVSIIFLLNGLRKIL